MRRSIGNGKRRCGGASTGLAAISVAAVIAHVATASGGETVWIGPAGGGVGSFDVPRHWSDGVPGAFDTALFLSPGTAAVSVPSISEAHRILVRGGDVVFLIADLLTANSTTAVAHAIGVADVAGSVASMSVAGALHGGHAVIGAGPSADGAIVVESDGSMSLSGTMIVGADAHGAVTVYGSLHALTIEAAKNGNGHGAFSVDGGAAQVDLITTVGALGTAELDVIDAGALVTPELIVGLAVDAVGGVTVSGHDSTVVVTDNLRVAHAGTGTLAIVDGATVEVGGDMIVAAAAGTSFPPYEWPATGSLRIDGHGSRLDVDGTMTLALGFVDLEIVAGGAVTVGGDVVVNQPVRKSLEFRLVGSASGGDPLIDVHGDFAPSDATTLPYVLSIIVDPDDPAVRGSVFTLIEATSITLPDELIAPKLPPGSDPMIVSIGLVESGGRVRLVVSFIGDPDLDGDGLVDGADLGILLSLWSLP